MNRLRDSRPAATRTLKKTLAHLGAGDADLGRAAALVGPLPDRSRAPGFAALLQILCEQQLSVASAAAIWSRVAAAASPLAPESFLALPDERLRALGLSRAKILYGKGLAQAVTAGALDLDALETRDDEAAMAALTAVKGVGRWTAEIYLLFALGRGDVWPADDLALQAAAQHLKGLDRRPGRAEMVALAEPWRPYRGTAARLLWAYYRHIKGMA